MSASLFELTEHFGSLWPISGAEDWDRPGLATGDPKQTISKVLLTVDVTAKVLEEAKAKGCELVVSHHPLLLKGVNFLAENQLKGELISFAIRNSIALYSAHTNADIVVDGVSDVLAQLIGIQDAKPLLATGPSVGHGRIGNLKKPLKLSELAQQVSALLPKTNAPVKVAGPLDAVIEKVAVVGGAGDSFIEDAKRLAADCLITSDLRHHVSLDAVTDPSRPLSLIDVSHYAAESLWLSPTADSLSKKVPTVEFLVSEVLTDPWTMTI
jgi:dinuclear metal center YbgI/SA1388 family protein